MSDIRPGGQPGHPGERPSAPSPLWPQGLAGVAGQGSTPPSPTPEPDAATRARRADADVDAAAARKRRLMLIGGIAGGVVVVGGVMAALLLGGDDSPTPATDAATVFLPSPTPSVAPVAREAATAFAAVLPVSVLQYALATSANDDAWLAANAIEAYTETFTDGASGTVTVQAGQWETPEEAAAHAARLAAELPAAGDAAATADPTATPSAPAPESGEVTVAGAAVGTYTIGALGADGVAVWSNGTTVFRATGPAEVIHDFYKAFPL